MYDTYTYDNKYNVELFYIIMKYGNFPCFVKRNVQKIGTPSGTLAT